MIGLTKKTVTIMMILAMIIALTPSLFINGVAFAAETNTVSTTEEAQNALDDAAEGDAIILDEGTYGTLYLRNDNSNANRILQDVTIKAATGKAVHVEQIVYQKITGKSLDIENLVIDGLDFNVPEKTGVLVDVDGGGSVRVNGLTVQNCTKIGNKSTGTTYDNAAFIGLYYDGTTAIGTKFAGDNIKTCGYHDIKILNNNIEAVLQPIKCPNAGPLYGMTVSGNTFTDCLDNHMMLSTKTTGTVTVSDNTFDKMTGRAMRISGAEADAKFVFRNNTITNPQMYDTGGDGDLTKITGTAGFQVITDTNNDWVKTVDTPTKWLAMGIVAKIGDTAYGTFEDALAAAENKTVKLYIDLDLTNYPEMKYTAFDIDGCTLDLDGHTFTVNDGGVVYQGDNMTIKNGKFIVNTSASEYRYAMHIGDERATKNVVVENVECTGGINVYNTGNAVIKDAYVVGTTYYAVWADEDAEVIIESGTFTSASTKGNAVIANAGKSYDSVTIIKGGQFSANGTVQMFLKGSNVILMGGTFNVNPKLVGGDVTIFKGYKVVDNGDGTWSVIEDNSQGEVIVEETSKTLKVKTNIAVSDLNLTPAEIEAINAGGTLKAVLEVEKVKIPQEGIGDAAKVKALVAEKKMTFGTFIDVNLYTVVDDGDCNAVVETKNPIAITVQIPEEIRQSGREYSIIRVHNGQAEVLTKGKADANWNITFETDKFSTYAIAYTDSAVDTGDHTNVVLYVILGVVAILGLIVALIAKKRSVK